MKTIYVWRSPEAELEALTDTKPIQNVFHSTLQELQGKPAEIILQQEKVPAIIVSSGSRIVAVRRFANQEKLLIRTKEIVAIGFDAT